MILKKVHTLIAGTTKLEKSNRYSFKVTTKAIEYVNKDKTR